MNMCNLKLILCLFLLSLLQVNSVFSGRKCYVDYSLGTCTHLDKCPHLVVEIVLAGKPMPLYMRNKLQQQNCGYDGNLPLVCCVPPNETDAESRRMTETHGQIKFNKTRCEDQNARIPDIENHPNLELLPTNCGVVKDRIVGGTRAQLFEMPWMVLLSYDSFVGTQLNCDGTLINEWYVLTAAHCVKLLPNGLDLKHVVLGEYDIEHNPDCDDFYGKQICAPSIKTVAIAEVITHPGYNKDCLMDDIALIRLSEPADFSSDSIKPICLPLTSQLQKEKLVGRNSVVAGWGLTERGVKSSVLLKVSLPILTKEDCQGPYEGQAIIHNQQLCAGGVSGKDSCGGDSGGPLMFPGKLGPGSVKTIQRGIVSFGTRQCGLVPGVYTNVAYYMDWILDNMHS